VDKLIRPLLLNTNDVVGGAARAAYRLHRGLQAIGIPSRMLVRTKESLDPTVLDAKRLQPNKLGWLLLRFSQAIDRLPLVLARQRPDPWGIGWFPNGLSRIVDDLSPDLVHLHWITGGFVPVRTLARLRQPVVWTLHDDWPLTGGCNLAGACRRFQEACGRCPQLGSSRERDLSRRVHNEKVRAWRTQEIIAVAPSRWLAERAKSSRVFRDRRIEVIPNGIDTQRHRPLDKAQARAILGLPENLKIILFGAVKATSDPNKGFSYLQGALQSLPALMLSQQVMLLVFGAEQPENEPVPGFATRYLGQLCDDVSLALAYSAADVVVVPSRQEAFGLVAAEAQACGTPAVAFDGTGLRDIIDHQQTGYLARSYEVEDLARGICWVLEDGERWRELSRRARAKVKAEFELTHIARRYADLYAEVLATHRARSQQG